MTQAQVTAFFLFDVADSINLTSVREQIEATVTTRLRTKPAAPPYLQYQQPPVAIDGAAVGVPEINGYRVRFTAFDYGVVSVAFTRALRVSWDELLDQSISLQDNPQLNDEAERRCRQLLTLLTPAIVRPKEQFLAEDYVVFTILTDPVLGSAETLLHTHGSTIAQLLRGERAPLSGQEREEVLRHRISYYADDVAIVAWNSAFLYDTEEGARGAIDILEYANSQLLEFRYYDQLLEAELGRTYARLQGGGWSSWASRRYTRALRQVQTFFIDVNELTDRTENALKIAGDVYAARLFNMTAARLGLDQWKANVRDKLKTLDDIYRFAVEHTSIARGEFLELTIVGLIVLEIVLLLAGIE
jgi:hypothetical protein